LFVGALVGWMATYYTNFECFNNVTKSDLYFLESWKGKLRLGFTNNSAKTSDFRRWKCWSIPDARMQSNYATYARTWGASTFNFECNDEEKALAVPYWLLALVTGCLAYFLKPEPKLQFTLLDTLYLSGLIAIAVGGILLWAKSLT
jgi:hypothetical protein